MLDFRILGPLEVLRDAQPLALGGPKARATLAILLLDANRVVSVERLADDLYAGAPPVTAVTQVQRQVSELRKVLGADAIETRTPGYVVRTDAEQLDLHRFEGLAQDAAAALERGEAEAAAPLYRRALDLWRGAPLADLAYEPFAQSAIARLEELRLTLLEDTFEAELRLGRHAQLLGELEALVWDHPLRERLRGQLMLALYRSGRQAEALELYRTTRRTLADEFGLEPTKLLQDLQHAMLTQDPSLDVAAPPSRPEPERTLLVAVGHGRPLDELLALARPLATLPGRTLLVARLVADSDDVAGAASALAALGGGVRTAAFSSLEPARDIVRLATNYDVELVLVAAQAGGDLRQVARHSPADLAVLHDGAAGDGGVFVAFGGSANDWAALELGAWLAAATSARLHLVGTTADPGSGRRDASRLLADASLAVQRVIGIAAEPRLAEPTADAFAAAVAGASVVVCGFGERWAAEGLRGLRAELAVRPPARLVFVSRGTRPGGLAPRESRTRFSWSLES